MTKLIITRGLPGSGKSTWAKQWVADHPEGRARINRDDLRAMAHDGTFVKGTAKDNGTERAIITARNAAITSLLRKGIDVIADDTNLPTRVVRDLQKLAVNAGAEVHVVDLTDVDLATCLLRDSDRENPVGEDVINDMYNRFIKGKGWPLIMPDEPEQKAGEPYVAPEGKPKAIMVDLDGTLALHNGRSPYDETRVHEDLLNEPVAGVVAAYYWEQFNQVIICSGRSEACREATAAWLQDNGIYYDALYMRAEGDARKDSVVKLELFDEHIRDHYNVQFVLDDRNQVVDMWRSIGLAVFQVAPGDF